MGGKGDQELVMAMRETENADEPIPRTSGAGVRRGPRSDKVVSRKRRYLRWASGEDGSDL